MCSNVGFGRRIVCGATAVTKPPLNPGAGSLLWRFFRTKFPPKELCAGGSTVVITTLHGHFIDVSDAEKGSQSIYV